MFWVGKLQHLPYAEIEIDNTVNLDEMLNTKDNSCTLDAIERELKYLNIPNKTLKFLFCPEKWEILLTVYTDYTKNTKPKRYFTTKKLLCDHSDENILYKPCSFEISYFQGNGGKKVHRKVSSTQKSWLKTYLFKILGKQQ